MTWALGSPILGRSQPSRTANPRGHVIGTLIAVALTMLVIYAFVRQLHEIPSISDLILMRVIWLIITTALNTARTGSISAFQLSQPFGSFGLGSGFSHDFARFIA